jgi:hypothetical protein
MQTFRSRGARSLVLLHERELRAFVATWRSVRAAGLALPTDPDPSYASLEDLLRHVLRAARGYLVWTSEVLGLPDPGVEPTPEPGPLGVAPEEYLEHVLGRWRTGLVAADGEALERTEARSRWGVTYCADGMLEHAVMHPLRHRFQLEEWLAGRRPQGV